MFPLKSIVFVYPKLIQVSPQLNLKHYVMTPFLPRGSLLERLSRVLLIQCTSLWLELRTASGRPAFQQFGRRRTAGEGLRGCLVESHDA